MWVTLALIGGEVENITYIDGILVFGLILVVCYIVWATNVIADAVISYQSRKSLKEAFEKSSTVETINWEQFKVFAERRHLEQSDIVKVLNTMIEKALTEKDYPITVELLFSFKEKQDQDEPFTGIPNELRVPLNKIKDEIKDGHKILSPLVGHLKEFSDKSVAHKKKQNILAVVSVLIGIVGVGYSVYSDSKIKEIEASTVNAAKKEPNKKINKVT
ncbi:MAG: hypothetical protein MJK12_15530 [Colwellia sp.]|nr:hypothetical protein [Colwellia sp.]